MVKQLYITETLINTFTVPFSNVTYLKVNAVRVTREHNVKVYLSIFTG